MELVIVGAPGTGTAGVGRALAARHGARFIDLTGDPARRPDAISGARLSDAPDDGPTIRRVIAADRIVVDTAVRARLYRGRRVVWLDLALDRIVERLRSVRREDVEIEGDFRPFTAQHLARYLPYYAAGVRVDASDSVAATIDRIQAVLDRPTGRGTLILRTEVHDGSIELGEGILDDSLVHVLQRLGARRSVILATEASRERALQAGRLIAASGIGIDVEELPDGETVKRLDQQQLLFRRLAQLGLHRADPLIAFGRDDLLEAATFSAAVWLRGVPLITVPVTTLGLIDTAIGGKGGIDLPDVGRNLVGAFHNPHAVILDVDLVHGESAADRRAALAEAVKYGLIGDHRLLSLLESGEPRSGGAAWPTGKELLELVERCALAKRRVVADDERDSGDVRIVLNLGHTVSHALEAATHYRLRHGEAVAYGLRAALEIGVAMGVTPRPIGARAVRLLHRLGLGDEALDVSVDSVIEYVESDKKRRGGGLRWVLVAGDGVTVRDDVPPEVVRSAVRVAIGGSVGP